MYERLAQPLLYTHLNQLIDQRKGLPGLFVFLLSYLIIFLLPDALT